MTKYELKFWLSGLISNTCLLLSRKRRTPEMVRQIYEHTGFRNINQWRDGMSRMMMYRGRLIQGDMKVARTFYNELLVGEIDLVGKSSGGQKMSQLKIYKYPFEVTGSLTLSIPGFEQLLKINTQNPGVGHLMAWVIVDPKLIEKDLKLRVIGTGHSFTAKDIEGYRFFDTVFDGPYVWHIFIKRDNGGE